LRWATSQGGDPFVLALGKELCQLLMLSVASGSQRTVLDPEDHARTTRAFHLNR
jgi:hypothetical protein